MDRKESQSSESIKTHFLGLQRKYLKVCLEIIFILIIVAGGFKALESRKKSPYLESDEPAWIFSGYYFNLYFLRFDFFHPDWEDYEAFDQPPLAKYIVGAAIYLKGYTIDSPDMKKLWNNLPVDRLHIFFELTKHSLPNPAIVIPFTRSVVFLFALFSLILCYTAIRILYGILPALISTSLIVSSPIHNYYSIRILADPILFFFFSLFFLLCALYWKSPKTIYIMLALVTSSLASLTKLNGVLLVPLLMIIILMKNRFSLTRQDLKGGAIGLIAFLLIFAFLNPVFLNTGIKAIWKLVEVRSGAFSRLQQIYPAAALLSVGDRFVYATTTIFFGSSLFYPLIKIPVELILFLLGVYYVLRRKDLFLAFIFIFLVIVPISMLPSKVPRYLYWIFPFVYIIAGLSSNFFKEMVTKGYVKLLKTMRSPFNQPCMFENKGRPGE